MEEGRHALIVTSCKLDESIFNEAPFHALIEWPCFCFTVFIYVDFFRHQLTAGISMDGRKLLRIRPIHFVARFFHHWRLPQYERFIFCYCLTIIPLPLLRLRLGRAITNRIPKMGRSINPGGPGTLPSPLTYIVSCSNELRGSTDMTQWLRL